MISLIKYIFYVNFVLMCKMESVAYLNKKNLFKTLIESHVGICYKLLLNPPLNKERI
jgi:hypothetical protein